VALGLVFCGIGKKEVPERLELYEKIRRNRASLIQVFSNAGQDEPELIQKEASKYIPLEQVPSMLNPKLMRAATDCDPKETPEQFFDYNFGYDVVQDSLNQLKQRDPLFELPISFFRNEPGRGVYPKETLYDRPLRRNSGTIGKARKPYTGYFTARSGRNVALRHRNNIELA
jgi:salicylate hydroxylase